MALCESHLLKKVGLCNDQSRVPFIKTWPFHFSDQCPDTRLFNNNYAIDVGSDIWTMITLLLPYTASCTFLSTYFMHFGSCKPINELHWNIFYNFERIIKKCIELQQHDFSQITCLWYFSNTLHISMTWYYIPTMYMCHSLFFGY